MKPLAIHGGIPVFGTKLALRWPRFGARDEAALLRVFRSGRWWRGGSIAEQADSACGAFERAFAQYHGAERGLACSNGTVALEVALRAAGVRAGDEVVVPDLSFVVSASACLTLGAVPVFADCDPATLQPDPAAVEAAITERTAAIVIVHFGGYPADLDRLERIASQHRLPLIEDCAHAHGTQWRGRGVGTVGRYGTFSFQQSKSLTSGEGGLLLCRDGDDWNRAYRYHNLGRPENQGFYDFHELSTNARMTDLQGALLSTQLAQLPRQVLRRMAAAAILGPRLTELGLKPLPADPRITRRGFFYYVFQYEPERFRNIPRERFLAAVNAEGVPVGRSYGTPIHRYPLFQNLRVPRRHRTAQYRLVSCPAAERAATQTLCTLPHALLLEPRATLDRVVQAFARVLANVETL